MPNSLSSLLAVSDGSVRFVIQTDRRQLPDRRTVWRGGRRLADRAPNLFPRNVTKGNLAPDDDEPRSARA